MPPRDWNPLIFAFSTLLWLGTIAVWICFPQFQLLNGTIVHRGFWSQPQEKIVTGWDRLTEEEKKDLQMSPAVERQLQEMQEQNKPITSRASWLGYQKRPGPNSPPPSGKRFPPNPLLHLVVGVGVAYFALLKYRGII